MPHAARRGLRPGAQACAEAVDHGAQGADLDAVTRRVVLVGVAPPVPAAVRVTPGDGHCLREQHDQAVGVGPAVVAGVLHEGGAVIEPAARRALERQVTLALFAAVQCDMEAAALARFAHLGDIHPACLVHARAPQEVEQAALGHIATLVELDETAGRRRARRGGRDSVGIDPAEDCACGVEIALADIGFIGGRAGGAEVDGGHRVPRAVQGDGFQAVRRQAEGAVVVVQLACDRCGYQPVFAADDRGNALAGDVGRVVDQALCGEALGGRHQRLDGRAVLGDLAAEHGLAGAGALRGGGDDVVLGAVVRAPGDDACALDDRRVRDLQLRRHEAAGGDARHRGLADVDVERGKWPGRRGRCGGGENCGEGEQAGCERFR